MPELAEVEFYRRVWLPGLNHRICGVEVHGEARVFRGTHLEWLSRIDGSCFHAAHARGKQLAFECPGAGWLGIHLGMTGELRVAPADFTPDRHDHLVLRQEERSLVFRDPRMFGRIRFDLGDEPPEWWQTMPPDILSPGFTPQRLRAFLASHRTSPLKALLLDQTQFPGIGNWMADEILWRGCWNPGLPGIRLSVGTDCNRLRRITREVARDALRVIAPAWGDAPDSWLFNHRWKAGGRCPREGCDEPLKRETIRGRTTCWCPRCQDLDSK